jgi:hypothetical protein
MVLYTVHHEYIFLLVLPLLSRVEVLIANDANKVLSAVHGPMLIEKFPSAKNNPNLQTLKTYKSCILAEAHKSACLAKSRKEGAVLKKKKNERRTSEN